MCVCVCPLPHTLMRAEVQADEKWGAHLPLLVAPPSPWVPTSLSLSMCLAGLHLGRHPYDFEPLIPGSCTPPPQLTAAPTSRSFPLHSWGRV